MKAETKIKTAEAYNALHKKEYQVYQGDTSLMDDDDWIAYYDKLAAGDFGNVRRHVDDYDDLCFEVEISGHQTASGNPYLFTWDDEFDLDERVSQLYDELYDGDEAYSNFIRASAHLNDALYDVVKNNPDITADDLLFVETDFGYELEYV